MTDPVSASHLQEIALKAVDAAQLATEAAHEAEAAIAARNDAALTLNKTARQTQYLALGTMAGAVMVLAAAGVFWARASSHLGQAAEVHAAATATFIENLMQMNTALDQMQQVIDTSAALADRNEHEVAVLIARLDQRLDDIAGDFGRPLILPEGEAAAPAEVLIALAEVELRLSRQISDLVIPAAPAVSVVAPPAQQTSSASMPSVQQPRVSRPAARATSRPVATPPANPFRYP